jgi:hypothetical protein
MVCKLVSACLLVLFSVITVAAQEDRVDGYIGYQFVRVNPELKNPVFHFNEASDTHGFNTSVTVFLGKEPRFAGITAELAANFEGGQFENSLVTFMGGPTFQKRTGRVQPFVRGLVGVARARSAALQLTNIFETKDLAFSAAGGGGLDIKVAEGFALRLIQVDYLFLDTLGAKNNIRIGAGLRF